MVDLKKLQKEIYQNKVDKGFNVTDVNKEFCLTYGEVAEAYEAWRKKKEDLGEELADVAIYLLGLSEILGIDLEDEIQKKVYKNSKREYKIIDGVNTRVKEFDEESERCQWGRRFLTHIFIYCKFFLLLLYSSPILLRFFVVKYDVFLSTK